MAIDSEVIEKAVESINSRMGDRFSAKMVWRDGDPREPLVLMRDKDGNYIFEIYYDSYKRIYSVVPRGALGDISDEAGYTRNSIHNGFGFTVLPYSYLKDIYNKWKDEQRSELKKENNMSEFTLASGMFNKFKKYGIRYKFENGIYNPEKIIIITGAVPFDIALVRSIPNSESSVWSYEVKWINVPSFILAKLKIDRVKQYKFSDELIIDILLIERELNELPTIRAVDVIFNDPATIIIWADGSKTVVKAEDEKFDPEKGLAMAISKKVFGNKHDYYEVFKRYVGRYEKKQGKKNKG